MHAPLYSTIALIAEIFISAIILYLFYIAYKKNRFSYNLAIFALAYEILFNLSYMVSRTGTTKKIPGLPASIIFLAIFHGIFSLVMFIGLVVFLIFAWCNYRKGVNYFFVHKKMTIIFIILWLIAVFSGIGLYITMYS